MPNYFTDGALPEDTNNSIAGSGYSPNDGTVAIQLGTVTRDNKNQPSAPVVMVFSPTVAVPTPADSTAFAGTMPSVQMVQTGTGIVSPRRAITKFVQLQAQAITHATPVDVYTPTSGKKWRILGYNISTTVAGAIQFEDTTGNEVLRTPLLLAAAPFASGDMGNGLPSAAANNHLFLDVTVTGAVTGWIGIEEE